MHMSVIVFMSNYMLLIKTIVFLLIHSSVFHFFGNTQIGFYVFLFLFFFYKKFYGSIVFISILSLISIDIANFNNTGELYKIHEIDFFVFLFYVLLWIFIRKNISKSVILSSILLIISGGNFDERAYIVNLNEYEKFLYHISVTTFYYANYMILKNYFLLFFQLGPFDKEAEKKD